MGRKQRTDRPGAEAADRPSTEPSASLPKDSTQHCHSTRSLTAHAAPKSRIGDKRRRHRQSSHPQAFFFYLSLARFCFSICRSRGFYHAVLFSSVAPWGRVFLSCYYRPQGV